MRTLLIVTLIGAATAATMSVSAGDLKSAVVLNTAGAWFCDGVLRSGTWQNTTGSTLYIKKAQIWQGIWPNKQADIGSELFRVSDGSTIILFPQDAYANPNGVHQVISDFAPDYFVLINQDTVQANYGCTPVGGIPDFRFSTAIHIWYTVGAP